MIRTTKLTIPTKNIRIVLCVIEIFESFNKTRNILLEQNIFNKPIQVYFLNKYIFIITLKMVNRLYK